MLRLLSALIFVLPAAYFTAGDERRGRTLESGAEPHAQFEHVVIEEERRVKFLRGRITDPSGAALGGVLVEVCRDPHLMGQEYVPSSGAGMMKRCRVASLKTGGAGKFSFPRLPPGKYELRLNASGFNTLSYIVRIVSPKKRIRQEDLTIEMPVAH